MFFCHKTHNSPLTAHRSQHIQSQHHPGGYHVADVAEDDEDVEHGVYVGHLLEAVEHGAHDVGHAFTHDP